jgi:16S rRNA (cytosine967-C5)-methyltransferase
MTPPAANARDAALDALARAEHGNTFLQDHLHAVLEDSDLDARDCALATQLATGVVRHRRTLRLFISHLRGEKKHARTIQPEVLRILEVGAFQLLLLDRVPAYAAVNEAVDAARGTARPGRGRKVAGFVNAVLRNLQRLIAGHESDGTAGPDALPHPDGGVVRLAAPVLPDPADGLAPFLGAAYSYPDWLVVRWVDAFGEEAEAICRWQNRRPHVFARVNPRRHTAEALLEDLQAETPGVAAGPRPGVLDVSALPAERLQRLAEAGDLTVQDPSAAAAVEALAPRPGETVLDLCAAPGTKTTQIAEATGDRGGIVASDKSEEKLAPLRQTVAARGLENVTVCLAADVAAHAPAGGFDAVLVDAPCSNTGVLARRVEARWRLRPDDVADLAALQRRLLEQATGLVRPGGRLVYSTCSLLPEENDGLIAACLEGRQGWTLADRDLILPGPDHDGAFWARLRREDE